MVIDVSGLYDLKHCFHCIVPRYIFCFGKPSLCALCHVSFLRRTDVFRCRRVPLLSLCFQFISLRTFSVLQMRHVGLCQKFKIRLTHFELLGSRRLCEFPPHSTFLCLLDTKSVTCHYNNICLYRVSRGNVPDFGRMFLTLKYTDITQNTCIRS